MKFKRITIDPDQMGGVPCIRHMRMPVVTVLKMVASGMTTEEIISEFPFLESDDVREALLYAAVFLEERTLKVTPGL